MKRREDFVSNDDIIRYDELLEQDELTPKVMKENALIKEVFYAGLWLLEQLDDLDCPEQLMLQIQYTHGGMSFGNPDGPWAVAEQLLTAYKSGELKVAEEPKEEVEPQN